MERKSKLKHIPVTEEQYWIIRKEMMRLKLNFFHEVMDVILKNIKSEKG